MNRHAPSISSLPSDAEHDSTTVQLGVTVVQVTHRIDTIARNEEGCAAQS